MDWELTLRYLTALVWPATTLAICYWFKQEIAGLLNRIIGGELPGGFKFSSPPTQKTPNENVPDEIKESVAQKKEENAEENKEKSAGSKEDAKEQVIALLSQVAELQTALVFERVYQNIFGSQIKLLEELRLRGTIGASYEDIAAYYQQTKIKSPNLNSYLLESYLNYLKNGGLIEMFLDGSQKKYKITSRGVDFLEYIEKLGYTKEKQY